MLYNTIMEDESAKKVAFNVTKERNNLIKKIDQALVSFISARKMR